MINSNYFTGNIELLNLFKNTPFNIEKAENIIKQIDDINVPILDEKGYSTTYLYEAQYSNNIDAVRLLLEYGADPNYYNSDLLGDCALWYLQYAVRYPEEVRSQEIPKRYEIAKLFFEFGANPDLIVDGESLYEYVSYKIFNEEYDEIIDNFYKLIVAYKFNKQKDENGKSIFSKEIDFNKIDEYKVKLFLCDDGYHIEGHLLDPNDMDIGVF